MKKLLRLLAVALALWSSQVHAGQITAQSAQLSAIGSTTPFKVQAPTFGNPSAGYLFPGVIVSLSSGAQLIYSVQVTGDNCNAAGYVPANGNWAPFTNMAGLTTSAASTLGAAVSCIRLVITSWTSGTATFQFIEQGN